MLQILSTALWHEQDARRLSMLAADLTENARLSPESWCVAGNCFSVQKQHETAVECLERAVSLDNQFAYAYSLLGHELLDTEQLDKAAAAFRYVLFSIFSHCSLMVESVKKYGVQFFQKIKNH